MTPCVSRCGLVCLALLLARVGGFAVGAAGETSSECCTQRKQAAELWEAIKETEGDRPDESDQNSVNLYWLGVLSRSGVYFDKLFKHPCIDEKLEYFVGRFGKHGPHADLRWAGADANIILPVDGKPFSKDTVKGSGVLIGDVNLRQAQLRIAEPIARRLLKDEDFLKRYWHLTAWSGQRFAGFPQGVGFQKPRITIPISAGKTFRGISKGPDEEYWWWARNFILLAYATGRNDLLKNAKPDDLQEPAQKWYRWFRVNQFHLRPDPDEPRWVYDKDVHFTSGEHLPAPHFPSDPLPDWSGFPPPEKGLLSDI